MVHAVATQAVPPDLTAVERRSCAVASAASALDARLQALTDETEAPSLRSELCEAVWRLTDTLTFVTHGPCRVVCVGRTRAGKSTLRFVLTGDGEDGIGRGGQRTTTEVIEYTWRDLIIVDTPGVGAFEGDEDAALAAAAASMADLVVWVVGSDGLQVATIGPVLGMLRRGVPLLVVVNHKDVVPLDALPYIRDEQLFTDLDARERRLREVTGQDHVAVVHAQLDIARSARHAKDGQAWARSRADTMSARLHQAAEEAVHARPTSRTAALLLDLESLSTALEQVHAWVQTRRQGLAAERKAAEAQRLAARRAFDEEVERGFATVRRTAKASMTAACRHANAEEHRGEAQKRLTSDLRRLWKAHSAGLQQVVSTACASSARRLVTVSPGPDVEGRALPTFPMEPVELEGNPLDARAANQVRTVLRFTPLVVVGPLMDWVGPNLAQERIKRERSVSRIASRFQGHLTRVEKQARADAGERFGARVAAPSGEAVASLRRREGAMVELSDAIEQMYADE